MVPFPTRKDLVIWGNRLITFGLPIAPRVRLLERSWSHVAFGMHFPYLLLPFSTSVYESRICTCEREQCFTATLLPSERLSFSGYCIISEWLIRSPVILVLIFPRANEQIVPKRSLSQKTDVPDFSFSLDIWLENVARLRMYRYRWR